MAEIGRFVKKTNMKTRVISILLVVAILCGSFMWFGNNDMGNVEADGMDKPYAEYIVDRMANGMQGEFKILEIVPYDGFGEFRYYLEDGDNAFVKEVFGTYADIVYDRIHLDTVEANDLTEELIVNADLIIFSTQPHSTDTLTKYGTLTGITTHNFYDKNGNVVGSDVPYYNTYENVGGTYVSRDAEWAMCEALLDVTINGRAIQLSDGTSVTLQTPVIMDYGQSFTMAQDLNVYKLSMIYRTLAGVENIDNSSYVEPSVLYAVLKNYMATSTADGYVFTSETSGLTTPVVDTTATGVFGPSSNVYFGDSGSCAINTLFVNYNSGQYSGNIVADCSIDQYKNWLTDDFWVFEGTSLLIPDDITATLSDKPLSYDKRIDSTPTTEEVLQYLLGLKPTQTTSTYSYGSGVFRVLEIEPCNSFDYDTFDEVQALGIALYMDGARSWTSSNYTNYIKVDCVTTNALNGMTDDIIADYDMIIIGDNIEMLTKDSNGKTIYNDQNLNGYIYLAYGDLFKIGSNALGMLPTDYVELTNSAQTGWFYKLKDSTSYLYTDYVYQSLKSTYGQGKVFITKNMFDYYKPGGNYGETTYDYTTGELFLKYALGNVRGSDNDITDITKSKLVKYAQSGKTIVLADCLYNLDGNTVYPTSDIYDFAKTMATKDGSGNRVYNVIRQDNIGGAVLNRGSQVPEITMISQPAEPTYDSNGIINTFGSRDIDFKFELRGQAGATYRIKLYVDRNSDGVYKGVADGAVADENELYYAATVTLTSGNSITYTINSELSDNFVGMLCWKIEVMQLDAAGNETSYATSVKGYSAIRNEEPQDIRVLQILPDQRETLDMSANTSSTTDFRDLLDNVKALVGYDITIETVRATQFAEWYDPAKGGKEYTLGTDQGTTDDRLRSYDMVVIGFADMYGAYGADGSAVKSDISNANGALDNLTDYMDAGNAVLFTHDTLSWRVTPNHVVYGNQNGVMGRLEMYYARNIWTSGDADALRYYSDNFAYEMTLALRERVGMDKYGVTLLTSDRDDKEVPTYASADTAPKYTSASSDGKYYVQELQGFNQWFIYRNSFLSNYTSNYKSWEHNLYSLKQYTGSTLGQQIIFEDEDAKSNPWVTTQVVQLNEGAVTMYPYQITENLQVATTHAQYYELNMEDEDIVVWYTLSYDGSTSSAYYGCTEKDAGNNYYIYSKDNITYSGAGHSDMSGSATEMERKLFVNTLIKAIAGGNSAPELTITNGSYSNSGGMYIIYTPTVNTGAEYEIDIKATDLDLVSLEAAGGNEALVGAFKEAKVYWIKNDGTEQLIYTYGNSNPLKNGIISYLHLGDTNLTSAELATIEKLVEGDEYTTGTYAQFKVIVSDWKGASDTVFVRLIQRDLFNLE